MHMHLFRRSIALLTVAAALVVAAPSIASAFVFPVSPGGTAPLPVRTATDPGYTGPTPDVAAVANHISYRAKSVTTVISIPPGLALTAPNSPVHISPLFSGVRLPAQNYNPVSGNRIAYEFPEGDQLGHVQNIEIDLDQVKPGVGDLGLPIRWNPMITPLYDVTISPLTFTLADDCEWIGDTNVVFSWLDPAGGLGTVSFSLGGGQSHVVSEFASTWTQVSASSALVQPRMNFYDDYWTPARYAHGWAPPPAVPLVPGTSAAHHDLYSAVMSERDPCRA